MGGHIFFFNKSLESSKLEWDDNRGVCTIAHVIFFCPKNHPGAKTNSSAWFVLRSFEQIVMWPKLLPRTFNKCWTLHRLGRFTQVLCAASKRIKIWSRRGWFFNEFQSYWWWHRCGRLVEFGVVFWKYIHLFFRFLSRSEVTRISPASLFPVCPR